MPGLGRGPPGRGPPGRGPPGRSPAEAAGAPSAARTTVTIARTRHALRRRERVVARTRPRTGTAATGALALAGHALRGRERVVARTGGRRGLARAGTDSRAGRSSGSGRSLRGGRGRARGSRTCRCGGCRSAGPEPRQAGRGGRSRCRRGARGLDRCGGCGCCGGSGGRGGRRACRCLRGGCCCGGGTSATDRVGVTQLADDRRFDGRGCRADEFTELVQLGHDGLAVDPELFGELVDADLGHISPVSVRPDRVGPSLVLGTHRWVLIGACSSGSHRLPTRFPYRRSASPPGTTRRRPAPAAPRGGGAPRPFRAALQLAGRARTHAGVRPSRDIQDRGAAMPPCPASGERRPRRARLRSR